MESKFTIKKQKKVLFLSSLVFLFELSRLVMEGFFHKQFWYYQFIHIALTLGTLTIVFFLLKGFSTATQELEKSNQKLNNIFDTLDVAIWSHDLKTNILLITPGIEKLYGYSSEDFYKDLNLWKKVILPEDLPVISDREQQLLIGEPVTSIYRIIRPDGKVRWIQDRGFPTLNEAREFVDFTSVLFDITDQRESEDQYRSIVEMSPDIIAVIRKGVIEYINEAGCKLVGERSTSNIIGKNIGNYASEQTINEIQSLIRTKDTNYFEKIRMERQAIRVDGQAIDVEFSAMPILYGGRPAMQVVGRDITERKKAEKTIQHMAYFDSLTGLPNRNKFRDHLNEILANSNPEPFAVLFLDLDRFKVINDTKGHTTGDLLLKQVALRLRLAAKNIGMVFRQGGDEFIILLEDINKETVVEVCDQFLVEFSSPLILEEEEFYVTPSIGISLYPDNGEDIDTLIKHADTAMYIAKERGKNNYQFYTDKHDGPTLRKMELENKLRKVLDYDQLVLHYQPQVDLEFERIVGVEALVRWNHPELGIISPGEFIPLAEETGLIVQLGKWILKNAIQQNKAWQRGGLELIPVAVNISVRQLQEDDFVDYISDTLQTVGLDPKYLELEITESIMQNIDRSTQILDQLKQIGVKLSIDDFGTGYSSLSYLKHLPIDNIKIDKSFIDDILVDNHQGSIVKAIIDMGQNMNFSVIAEGIEQEEQVHFLIQNFCKKGQGYYFSKPLPAGEICNLLKKNSCVV
ncbi:EAL and GGDEF domain-containing protein [Peribacillus alkalitolerans]|uniref:sensor domain-containing protein n=1 Tax=Peribacillus alkalitolerans TaxID=1550385 RepID=UPI001F073CE6|nr:EAL domain-containing protein [Peribacillus alkalitolerans]